MNLKIREFKMALENYIESVDIPVEVKRMAIKEIYDRISTEANAAVSAELDERESAEGKGNGRDE